MPMVCDWERDARHFCSGSQALSLSISRLPTSWIHSASRPPSKERLRSWSGDSSRMASSGSLARLARRWGSVRRLRMRTSRESWTSLQSSGVETGPPGLGSHDVGSGEQPAVAVLHYIEIDLAFWARSERGGGGDCRQ